MILGADNPIGCIPGQGFTGSYLSTDGTQTVLSFAGPTSSSAVGSVQGNGLSLRLEGEIDGALMTGMASGPGGSLHFHAAFVGELLNFTLYPTTL